MSKEEIALELTKLIYPIAHHDNKMSNQKQKQEELVTNLYNYIFSNMTDSKHSEA